MTVSTTILFGNVLLVELKAALEKQKGMKVKAIPCCFLQEDKCLVFSIQKVLLSEQCSSGVNTAKHLEKCKDCG